MHVNVSDRQYLLSDVDEEGEDDDDEDVVNDADSSNGEVDHLECDITDVSEVRRVLR